MATVAETSSRSAQQALRIACNNETGMERFTPSKGVKSTAGSPFNGCSHVCQFSSPPAERRSTGLHQPDYMMQAGTGLHLMPSHRCPAGTGRQRRPQPTGMICEASQSSFSTSFTVTNVKSNVAEAASNCNSNRRHTTHHRALALLPTGSGRRTHAPDAAQLVVGDHACIVIFDGAYPDIEHILVHRRCQVSQLLAVRGYLRDTSKTRIY